VTGEEFSLASEEDFVTKDDDDDEDGDPEKRTAVPRARQRATEAHLPTKPKLYSELWPARRLTRGPETCRDDRHRLAAAARAGNDARSNKEADIEANRQAIEKGAGQKATAGEVDRDHKEAAHAAATATKTHHTARKGSGARSPPSVDTGRKRYRLFLLGPQVSAALFGSTGGKHKGNTR
jgi:hypothetical protein